MSEIQAMIEEAAKVISTSRKTVALTGAGISVESGIPSFRGSQGLWAKYDPMEYAHIDAFRANPGKVWAMLKEMHRIIITAKPNPAHLGLADMEKLGCLDAIITQNIDNLHQDAGSTYVIEFHGNGGVLLCLDCKTRRQREEISLEKLPPKCTCGGLLKPDVVFFGEPIPWKAMVTAREESKHCDVMLVIGTSAVVVPACDMPVLAKSGGGKIIEINIEETPLTSSVSEFIIKESAGIIMPRLVEQLRKIRH